MAIRTSNENNKQNPLTSKASAGFQNLFDTSNVKSVKPVLPDGMYAAKLSKLNVVGSDGKQYFVIRESKKQKEGKRQFYPSGMISLEFDLISRKAYSLLNQAPELPIKFFSTVWISFQVEDDGSLTWGSNNETFGQLLERLSLRELTSTMSQEITYDRDSVTLPVDSKEYADWKEFYGVKTDEVLHYLNMFKEFFKVLGRYAVGKNVLLNIKRVVDPATKVAVNEIASGTRNAPYIGFETYTDGAEDDLSDN